MVAGSTRTSLALDTNVVLDLAEGEDFAHEFREVFQGRGYGLLLPPTVTAELDVLASRGTFRQRTLARTALENLGGWKCMPLALSSTHLVIARQFATRLVARGLIPETEQNDGKILAQTSLACIPLLATSDHHLLGIDDEALLLAFQEADLWPVHPVHPRQLLKALH